MKERKDEEEIFHLSIRCHSLLPSDSEIVDAKDLYVVYKQATDEKEVIEEHL